MDNLPGEMIHGREPRSKSVPKRWIYLCFSILILAALSLTALSIFKEGPQEVPPIKVGILHSLTGTMAISEKPIVDSLLLAIEEVNARGGLLGARIIPVVVDGKSDLNTFAEEAEHLITEEQVAVVFGCWTSASRKIVKPIFEQYNHLLMYSVQYEGLEQSPNIFYLGGTPNQQMLPAVRWGTEQFGSRIYLVGSDYIYPRVANAMLKDFSAAMGVEIVGEAYVPLGSDSMDSICADIERKQPDLIINTLNGDSNISFFQALMDGNFNEQLPAVMSFSISETEAREVLYKVQGTEDSVSELTTDRFLVCQNYFQNINTRDNKEFVSRFRVRFGEERVISSAMASSYTALQIWAHVVDLTESTSAMDVSSHLGGHLIDSPAGMIYFDRVNHHIWMHTRIGQLRPDGQFDIVWDSGRCIRPLPYPSTRSRSEWAEFLDDIYRGYDNNWMKLDEQER